MDSASANRDVCGTTTYKEVMMQINHNVRAMVTQQALSQNNGAMSKSLEKLSSGLRINRAQDDAAGLAMSEQMRTQIRGLGKAKQNTQDGMAALQIAEGALAEITSMIQRQRELAIQASNDTLKQTERSYLYDEFKALTDEINRIAATTDYNGINMLKDFGRTPPGESFIGFLQVGANSYMRETANCIKVEYNISIAGIVAAKYDFSATTGAREKAEEAVSELDIKLKEASSVRATIGTFINRLEYTNNNIANLEYNTQDAESRIRDTNFATETTSFTRNQIMVQSATNILAQANMLPQNVLGLLG